MQRMKIQRLIKGALRGSHQAKGRGRAKVPVTTEAEKKSSPLGEIRLYRKEMI